MNWTRYAEWNEALAGEFFTGRYGGHPVYIDLEDDVLLRLAGKLGLVTGDEAEADLIDTVAGTLGFADGLSVFGCHMERLRRWRRTDRAEAPPVIAVLALQSLVAERMQQDADFRADNYYNRFLQVIHRDPLEKRLRDKLIRGFWEQSDLLWLALNKWLEAD